VVAMPSPEPKASGELDKGPASPQATEAQEVLDGPGSEKK
jgi:hypothetical protein